MIENDKIDKNVMNKAGIILLKSDVVMKQYLKKKSPKGSPTPSKLLTQSSKMNKKIDRIKSNHKNVNKYIFEIITCILCVFYVTYIFYSIFYKKDKSILINNIWKIIIMIIIICMIIISIVLLATQK